MRNDDPMTMFQRTTTTYQQGARTMPGEYYTSPDILVEEHARIFASKVNEMLDRWDKVYGKAATE